MIGNPSIKTVDSEARIGSELSSTNTRQICNSCNCSSSRQTPSPSLRQQNPESSSPGSVFSTETFRGADTNSEVGGDNDFDEKFFKEEIRKYPCI